jgi:hypothetical protein
MAKIGRKARTVNVLKLLTRHLKAYFTGTPPPLPEQRVNERLEQRVTEASIPAMTPLPEIQRVSDAPHTMVANNPTSKRIMQNKPRTHQRSTRRNTPGALPQIIRPFALSTDVPFRMPHIIEETPYVSKSTHGGTTKGQKTRNEQAKTLNETHHGQTYTISELPHHQPGGNKSPTLGRH